jgi:hypothetical protein
MGAIIASIPYKSQYDPDANEFRNDCGPACLAMVLGGFGISASTNAVHRRSGVQGDRYVSITQLMNAASSYGLTFEYFYAWTVPQLIETVRSGKAVIALVHYGAWSQMNPGISTQNTFQGPHFVVVIGADDRMIYVNDPLWKEERRAQGFRKAWTHAQFYTAWSACHLDGNRDCSGIVTQQPLPTTAYGRGEPALLSQAKLDPQTVCRLRAWAFFNNAPLPTQTNPATLYAYLTAMGRWAHYRVQHTVASGDDLGLLALRYYDDPMKYRVIEAFNGLNPGDTIMAGDVLLIPEPRQFTLPAAVERKSASVSV